MGHHFIKITRMKNFDINEDPHRRYNPLINEWVLAPIVQTALAGSKRKKFSSSTGI
jgi:hypothetical protein